MQRWISLVLALAAGCGSKGPPTCGDGKLTPPTGEECDDPDDAFCDDSCRIIAGCGNGRIDEGEECDPGRDPENSNCPSTCLARRCGDGTLDADEGEDCDDGNIASGDGCSATCDAESNGCPSVQALTCGAPFVQGMIGGPGSANMYGAHSCLPETLVPSNDTTYEFVAPTSGTFSVGLESSMPGRTRVVVYTDDGACPSSLCTASGVGGAQFTAVAGTRYLVVVDALIDTAAQYAVGMFCP